MVPFILVHVALASLQLKGAGKCRLAVQPGREGERDGSKAWLQSLIDSQNLILSEPHGTREIGLSRCGPSASGPLRDLLKGRFWGPTC